MFLIDDFIIAALSIPAQSTLATLITGATAIGVTAGTMSIQHQLAERAQSRSEKRAQAAAETQAKAAARARAVQNAPITAEQMQKVTKQREIGSLVDLWIEREKQGPRVYTLPTAEPSDPVTRINQAIHNFLTGAA